MLPLGHRSLITRLLVIALCVSNTCILYVSWSGRRGNTNRHNIIDVQIKTTQDFSDTSRFVNVTKTSVLNNLAPETKHLSLLPKVSTKTSLPPGHSYNKTHQDVIKRVKERVDFVREQCRIEWSIKLGPILQSDIFYDESKTLVQCLVAKAGSTYWGRIFSFLTRPEMMKTFVVNAPVLIDRLWLHHWPGFRGKCINGNDAASFFKDAKPLRFFFSRNPYKRLWSTYLDKYYLPSYWMINPLQNSSQLCQKNISFQTFLKDAVNSNDGHVLPVSIACNPCVFKPDVIGDMDSFTSDTEYILRETHYANLLTDYNEGTFVQREILSLSSYHFMSWRYFLKCLEAKELARRLWHVFQCNGYIRESDEFPENRPSYMPLPSTQMFLQASRFLPVMSRQEAKKQRHECMVGAYKKIPESVIQSIRHRFDADFALFRYDVNPPT